MEKGNYAFTRDERQRTSKKRKILYTTAIIMVGVVFGSLLTWLLLRGETSSGGGESNANRTCSLIPDNQKVNCHPDLPISEEGCFKRGCCFEAASDLSVTEEDLIKTRYLGVPSCFFPEEFKGYEIGNISRSNDGFKAALQRKRPSGFVNDIQEVLLDITFIDDTSLRVRLTDAKSERYEPGIPLHHKPVKDRNELYNVNLESNGILNITRKATGTVIFRTKLAQLVFSDQFLQLTTDVSSTFLYGGGEQMEGLLKTFNWTRLSMFNQGDLPVRNRNLYGSHPFYLVMEPNKGSANGLFLLNSNAMDIVLQSAPAATLRPIGGIFDFFIMLGPTPADVIKQYTGIVGRPTMIPYWSLGFHLCRYGYGTLNKTKETLERNLDAGVSVEVQWNDIDSMNRYLDFTYDPINFAGLPEWVEELHRKHMYYVTMISPGVSNSEIPGTYAPYDEGAVKDLFVKDINGKYFEGKVWNTNFTVFVDFSNPLTAEYWANQFRRFYSILKYDGVWIDMNEPAANFVNGTTTECPKSTVEDPAYLPGRPYPLRTCTICMTSVHSKTTHYNEHNLLGFREAAATYDAEKNIRKKRPFIISRATFSGQGVHSGHWSGDLSSDWDQMRYTVPMMMLFNMFGMPMIGSDICGFRKNTTEELCARWQALGAFYPFARNHNDYDTIEQDPAAFGLDSPVLKSTIDNFKTRYQLLPYFYTLFHRGHAFGEPPVRPLFFEFPNDKNVYDMNEEFLWGPALLIMPALYPGIDKINPYVPKGLWYDFYTGEKLVSKGEKKVMDANLTFINVAVRAGFVLPMQIPENTTTASRENAFNLWVALNEMNEATGELFWDDGDSLLTYENGNYNSINFFATNNTFKSNVTVDGYSTVMRLNEIRLYGLTTNASSVTINNHTAPYEFKETYLSVNATGYSLLENFIVIWST